MTRLRSEWLLLTILPLFLLFARPHPAFAQSGGFGVGDEVIIRTNGENLNLRQGAGVSFPIVAKLVTGTVMQVVGGPVTADGYEWWELEGTPGRGWAAGDYLRMHLKNPLPLNETGEENSQVAWFTTLTCEEADKVYSGIEYCTAFMSGNGVTVKVHVIVIDTHNPGVGLEYLIASGEDKQGVEGPCRDVNTKIWGKDGCSDPNNDALYPVISAANVPGAVGQIPNAAAYINGDYSACTVSRAACEGQGSDYRGHGPEGLVIIDGGRIDGPGIGDTDNNAENRPFIVAGGGSPLQVWFDQVEKGKDNKSYEPCVKEISGGPCIADALLGMGGGPWLIRDGELQIADIAACKNTPGSCREDAAQTAVGQTADRRWLFLVAMEAPSNGQIMNLRHLAIFMQTKLDCSNAMKLDGGGSTALGFNSVVRHAWSRDLTNFLVVTALPGKGIDLSSVAEDSGGSGSWWQRIVVFYTRARETIVNLIAQVEAIRQQVQAIQEWQEQFKSDPAAALQKLLEELCVGPFSSVAVVAFGRRLFKKRHPTHLPVPPA